MINKIKLIIKFVKKEYRLLILLLISSYLRFWNLGYSDFQGDEIKALYLPANGENFFNYLMDQRKGPIQFIITYFLKFLDPTYTNQFLMRFLFALAGVLSVLFFYKLLKNHFGEKVSFYASFFVATNGFFIAFSRIVQYQSFVIMFSILALYLFTLAGSNKKWAKSGIILGFISWALSILSHYDGVFIAPFAFYLIYDWFKNVELANKQKIITIIVSLAFSGAVLASFYIPFIMAISQETMDYWSGRISGDVSSKLSSSRYLFSVYQPIYVIHIYTALFVFGLIVVFLGCVSRYEKLVKKLPSLVQKLFKPTTPLLMQIKNDKIGQLALMVWFLIPFVFLEIFVYIPGTHIYVYLIPMTVYLAFGIFFLESLVQRVFELKLVNIYNTIGISIVFAFIVLQSRAVFVENRQEYPWKNEEFFIWTFSKPSPVYHLSMFGFPYYRDWEGVSNFVNSLQVEAYSTNERKSISRHHIIHEKDTDRAGVYIYVKDPQSFQNDVTSEKPAYWMENYDPVFTFARSGSDKVRVYIMEPGTLEEIIEKGF